MRRRHFTTTRFASLAIALFPGIARAQACLPYNLDLGIGVSVSSINARVSAPASATVLDSSNQTCWLFTVYGTIRIHQVSPEMDFLMNGSAPGAWVATLDAPAQYGSCYTSTLTASATGLNRSKDGGEACWMTNPPPPPPIDLCDPGHNCDGSEPLVLDLEGDGIPTSSVLDLPVWFDMDSDGTKDQTAWTQPGALDAFLFYDVNGNGIVDDASELFGDASIRAEEGGTGFAVLATYDRPMRGGNGDLLISPADAIWGKLRLWIDANHDGACERNETQTLGHAGIVSIPIRFEVCGPSENYCVDAAGNLHYLKGSFQVRDHNSDHRAWRSIEDIYFVVQR